MSGDTYGECVKAAATVTAAAVTAKSAVVPDEVPEFAAKVFNAILKAATERFLK
jgi:hypothetical protein